MSTPRTMVPPFAKENNSTNTTTITTGSLASCVLNDIEQENAIQNLCQLIQYPTVSAIAIESGAYDECSQFLMNLLQNCDNVFDEVYTLEESPPNAPIVIARWKGHDETLPIILLNSHYDVVPANENDWSVPPFEGIRSSLLPDDNNTDTNNNTSSSKVIYGRGTQDMKCVCIQYIEAIRKIHNTKPDWKPLRDIYLSFVPDEEVGGAGMAAFLNSKLYNEKIPGIAIAFDEGLASEDNTYSLFYGERLPWWVHVTAIGPTGHGSRFIDNTAIEQIVQFSNKAYEYRTDQRHQIGLSKDHNCSHAIAAAKSKQRAGQATTTNNTDSNNNAPNNTLGDVTSLNVTMMEAGVRVGNTYAYNCIPPIARCAMDIRISPHTPPSEISTMLDQWCIECSNNNNSNDLDATPTLQWSFIGGHGNDMQHHATTSIDDPVTKPWYQILLSCVENCCPPGVTVQPQVFPAATDSRFLRALGVRAFGFTPIRNTPIMLHENDEYIPESVFIEGIGIYYNLIQQLGSFTGEN